MDQPAGDVDRARGPAAAQVVASGAHQNPQHPARGGLSRSRARLDIAAVFDGDRAPPCVEHHAWWTTSFAERRVLANSCASPDQYSTWVSAVCALRALRVVVENHLVASGSDGVQGGQTEICLLDIHDSVVLATRAACADVWLDSPAVPGGT